MPRGRALLLAMVSLIPACTARRQSDAPRVSADAGVSVGARGRSAGESAGAGQSLPSTPKLPVPPLPDPLPGTRRDVTDRVGAAQRVAIGNIDGRAGNEILVADAEALRALSTDGRELARAAAPGGIQVLGADDLDGDGKAEILSGWGLNREHPAAKAHVGLFRLQGSGLVEETVPLTLTTRHDVMAVLPATESSTPALLVAFFKSQYMVKSALAERGAGGWTLRDLAVIRTATSYARGDVDGDGAADLIVGRIYGDDKAADGDAFLLAADGSRRPIPTTRGVRGLAVFDSDGDRRAEVFLADGWHQNYGQHARGLLTWARWRDGAFHSELIEDTPGQFTIWRLLPADLDADGRPELVAQGSHYVRVYRLTGGTWRSITVAGATRDIAVGDLDSQPGDELLTLGDRSEIVSLRATDWAPAQP